MATRTQSFPLTEDPTWLIEWEGFDPRREHDLESLTTIGNGYLGTRGAVEEINPSSQPATLIAGVFDTLPETNNLPELVVAPNWLVVRVWIEDELLSLGAGEIIEHRRILDMRQGVLAREWLHRDPNGRVTRFASLRFASLADCHALGLRVLITPENYAGHIRVESAIEGNVVNLVLLPPPDSVRHLEPVAVESIDGGVLLAMRTRGRGAVRGIEVPGVTIAMAARTSFTDEPSANSHRKSKTEPVAYAVELDTRRPAEILEWDAKLGQSYRIDKLVSVWTSRDVEQRQAFESASVITGNSSSGDDTISRVRHQAVSHLHAASAQGFDALLAASTAAWLERWRDAEITIEGDMEAESTVRFAIYHLILAGNPQDDRVSISARTLSGESYKGHVFWDTEIFMVPFFTFTHPPAARALLMYRYWTLPGARAKARRFGYRGAMYAWESADTGDEAMPFEVLLPTHEVVKVLSGLEEHHISADVAYAVWQYWRATGDDPLMRDAGAEIIIECARFWSSRVQEGADHRFHIHRVIGADEYHETIDDNAFTNVMAQWTLECACTVADWMRSNSFDVWKALRDRIELDEGEFDRWRDIAARMFTGFDEPTGLIEQFAGFFGLEEVDLAAYEPRTAPMDILLGRQRTQVSQVVKQADVLMLFHLLPDRYPREVIEKNFRYYEPRTGHGSSLSPSTHALLAAQLGYSDVARHYFRQAANIDLDNTMGNASGGIHAAACGGLWQAVVFGFAGMELRDDHLTFDPHLPEEWEQLCLSFVFRGRHLRVAMAPQPLRARITLREGDQPLIIGIGPLQAQVTAESSVRAICMDGVWQKESG
ncbi:MAG: glycoside hydrolase family 65 protein [Acidobacteria bacterium]|nr:glycoside hydrolase family 65 protein [Acidobacteriota bacterium]